MPKRTAIIDIGSNSARSVIFERTSQYGFHLLSEQKSKVRIGEGAYEKGGYLQPPGIKRAFLALQSFLHTIRKYEVKEVICVATSALRDAPNGKLFVDWIYQELGLNIQIIDGHQEARYGALAANNLLPVADGITVDIGGGSSDMALLRDGKIEATYSLDIGTVRLKELFFDKAMPLEETNRKARAYIQNELKKLPETFKHTLAIGIGGTARTLSRGIMKRSEHPLDKLHAFTYPVKVYETYLHEIPLSSAKNLRKFNLKKNRYDTIREGTLIWNEILTSIGAETVITSSVGVREGVFLHQSLQENDHVFPKNMNPSITSILDRFKPLTLKEEKRKHKLKLGADLYKALQIKVQDNRMFDDELYWALKLSCIGKTLTIYRSNQHAFYIAMQELNYGFTHEQIVLISLLLRIHGKELLHKPLYGHFASLLPSRETVSWLSFIYSLTLSLHEASDSAKITFSYKDQVLTITSNQSLYLAKEKIKSLEKPKAFAILIQDENRIPSNPLLGT